MEKKLAKLDRTDVRILDALQRDGGLTNQQLAEQVGLSRGCDQRTATSVSALGRTRTCAHGSGGRCSIP